MSQIIKQPNGKYCLFSSIVDHITHYNMTPEEIIEEDIKRARKEITKSVTDTIKQLEDGDKPYCQFTMSYDEMLDSITDKHGEDKKFSEIIEIMNND